MNEATSGLIDIIEPAAPAVEAASHPWLWLAVALVLVVIAAIWWRRQRCQRAARKCLRQLRLTLLAGDMSQQNVAYVLASELAQAFQLKQLQADAPPGALPPLAHAEWAHMIAALDKLRYQTDTHIDTEAWERLFTIAASTLRRGGRC